MNIDKETQDLIVAKVEQEIRVLQKKILDYYLDFKQWEVDNFYRMYTLSQTPCLCSFEFYAEKRYPKVCFEKITDEKIKDVLQEIRKDD